MKNLLRISVLPAMVAGLLLTSCGGGSHWKGDATTPEEKAAQKICDCIGQTVDERGVDVDVLLNTDKAKMSEDRKSLSEEEFEKKYADYKAQREKFRSGGKPECLNALEPEVDKLEDSKVEEALEAKCDLAKLL